MNIFKIIPYNLLEGGVLSFKILREQQQIYKQDQYTFKIIL